MEISDADWSVDKKGTWLNLLGNHAEIVNICKKIDPNKRYTVTIKEERNHRSLDANAYAWKLINKLAVKLQTTSEKEITEEEIYRQYIPDIGDNFEMMLVKDENQKKICDIWHSKGTGWVTNVLAPSKDHEGYSWVRFYYGSSMFDTKQMSRLIDFIIDDCKKNGIEILPPDKIQAMKEGWN